MRKHTPLSREQCTSVGSLLWHASTLFAASQRWRESHTFVLKLALKYTQRIVERADDDTADARRWQDAVASVIVLVKNEQEG